MKTPLAMLLLCLLGAGQLFGQDSTIVQIKKEPRFAVYITPITILDFTPRYRIGATMPLAKRWEGAVAVGIGTQTLNGFRVKETKWIKNYRFYEIRPEVRYALAQGPSTTFMLALEGFYSYMSDRRFDGQYYHYGTGTETHIDYDEATFTKIKAGINMKAHLRILLSPSFYTEVYLGLGYGRRDIRYSKVKNPRPSQLVPFEEWFSTGFNRVGITEIPQMPFGFTLRYVFLRNHK